MSDAPLMLSVSGMRGLVGLSLTPPVAAGYAAAFGSWLKARCEQDPAAEVVPHVVLGRDSRPSGQMVAAAAAAGLVAAGCRVTDLGIVTTPTVAVMVEHLHASGGMVVTASHNPIIWNGLKALRHDGVAPPPDQAADIIARFRAERIDWAPVEALHPIEQRDDANRIHVDRVLRHVDASAIRNRKLKVVLDSVHGAGGPAGAMLLRELGVEVVHLYAQTTGRFPHTPEPTRENLTGLCEAVKQHKADLGFAQDPDADRLAVVDEHGTYIGEEYTLALAVMHVLQKGVKGHRGQGAKGAEQATAGDGPRLRLSVAANLSTSRMIDDIAARFGAAVHRTPVGEASVAAAMREHRCIVGGEGNGGVIFPPVVHVRDSLAGMALVCELLADTGRSLSAAAASIPAYSIVKDKLPIQPGMAERAIAELRRRFSDCRIDLQDGIRIDWPDRWAHLRASNTEPILRIIAEARDEAAAKEAVGWVRVTVGA